MADTAAATIIGPHGAKVLPSVEVDSYNLEIKDDEGFIGDRASRKAFHAILENWRKPLRKLATDPFGDTPSDDLSRTKLDEIVKEGKDLEAIAVIQSAIEEYAQELSLVVRRFLKAKAWEGTERIAMGGGFRDSYIGELAIARANLILKAEGIKVEMVPIHNDPDEAALLGALHLAPAWIFKGHDSILASRYRRHQHPRRCGAAQRRQGERSHQSLGVEVGEMAARRRGEAQPRTGGRRTDRHAQGLEQARQERRL